MSDFHRQRLTLDQAMQAIGAEWNGEPHITFDPAVQHQFVIRRGMAHDGTFAHRMQLIQTALMPLFQRSCYFKPMGELPAGMMPIYTVGTIKLFSVFGLVDLPAGRYPGERERIVIPVRCEYVKETA